MGVAIILKAKVFGTKVSQRGSFLLVIFNDFTPYCSSETFVKNTADIDFGFQAFALPSPSSWETAHISFLNFIEGTL